MAGNKWHVVLQKYKVPLMSTQEGGGYSHPTQNSGLLRATG